MAEPSLLEKYFSSARKKLLIKSDKIACYQQTVYIVDNRILFIFTTYYCML